MQSDMKKNQRGFTLIECLVALMLFAAASVTFCTAAYNCISVLDKMNKEPDMEVLKGYVKLNITLTAERTVLEDGLDFDGFNNDTITVKAEIEPTKIVNLFHIKFEVDYNEVNYSDEMFLVRPTWYEDSADRDELLEDRKQFLEEKRMQEAKM